jgi:hypothetical protein
MNKCPHCSAIAHPLRLFRQNPYICPKCGGRSAHTARWLGIRYFIAPAATGLSVGLLCDLLGLTPKFFLDHPWASIGVFVFTVVELFFWVVLIHWLSGRMVALPPEDQERDSGPSAANLLTPHSARK